MIMLVQYDKNKYELADAKKLITDQLPDGSGVTVLAVPNDIVVLMIPDEK